MGAVATYPPGYTLLTDARYGAIVARTLRIEGGHSNDPADRGGETKYGVSLRFLKAEGALDAAIFAEFDLDHDGDLDGADIRALTTDEVIDLFRRCLWIKPGYWALPKPFDAMLFDQGVNDGIGAANKLLQRAINRVSLRALVVDGALGPKSLDALTKEVGVGHAPLLVDAFRAAAAARYRAIVDADATQAKYLNGWLARARGLGDV